MLSDYQSRGFLSGGLCCFSGIPITNRPSTTYNERGDNMTASEVRLDKIEARLKQLEDAMERIQNQTDVIGESVSSMKERISDAVNS